MGVSCLSACIYLSQILEAKDILQLRSYGQNKAWIRQAKNVKESQIK